MARFVVVTPILNGAHYIAANLASIKAQSDADWLHYIVDGGSTDGSIDILRKAALEDPRRRVVTGTDRGLYDAVFKGFDQASADGVLEPNTVCVWLGSDDLIMPWAFATLRQQFDETGADWIAALPAIWDNAGRLVVVQPYNWYPRSLIRRGLFNNRGLGAIQQESTFFTYRLLSKLPHETVEQIRKSKLAGDFMLWREFAKFAPLVPVPVTVAGFRQHGENLSTVRVDSYLNEVRATQTWIPPARLGKLSRLVFRALAALATALSFRRSWIQFEADNYRSPSAQLTDQAPS